MGNQKHFAETVHKVEIPTKHYSLLVAENGSLLNCDTEAKLGLTDQGNDSILWNQLGKTEFQHLETGVTVSLNSAQNGSDRLILNAATQTWSDDEEIATSQSFTVEHGPADKPSNYLDHLRTHGWVCLTSILSDQIVEELERTACTDRYEHQSYDMSKPAICQNPAVAITAAEPISLWIIRQYMQIPDIKLGHVPAFAVLKTDAGKRNVQGWHSDFPYHWGTGVRGQVPTPSGQTVLGVQRNVCVSDFSKIRGATAFKLGSHALDSGPPDEWGTAQIHGQPGYREKNGLPYGGPESDIVEAPGGSIILYDSRTWHRAGVNRTEHPRAAMLQAMIPTYILAKNDTSQTYKQFLKSDVYSKLPDRVQTEIENLMVQQFIGPGGRYAITPDEELSERLRQRQKAVMSTGY